MMVNCHLIFLLTLNLMVKMAKIVLFNKPYGVHSQFRKDHDGMQTLGDFFHDKSLRVAGRLDKDSEGLLILTDSGAVNHAITTPPADHLSKKTGKTYLVQVENMPNESQIQALEHGIVLKDGKTLPCHVQPLTDLPIKLWERHPPIRERRNIPTAWLAMTIFEGKNRQIRRMVAHVGLPCLRLIRYQVGWWTLGDLGGQLAVGEHQVLHLQEYDLLKLGILTTPSKKSLAKRPAKNGVMRQKATDIVSKKPSRSLSTSC